MPESLSSNFTTIDWVIVAVYIAATLVIGLKVNRYIRNMADYLVAGRALKSYLGVATLIGSELGLVTVMYSAQKGFTGGFAAFHIGLGAGIVTLLVGLTGFIVVPLRQMGVMTIPEYYERRFGRGVRIFGGLLLAFAGILNMGMFLRAGAIFVTALTGMSDPTAVNIVMTVLIAFVLVYTVLGGMVSVVITDYIQFVVLSFGVLLACVLAVLKLGWTPIVQTVTEVHGEAGFDPFSGEGFGPSYVVWMLFMGLVSCAIWQTAVLRACSAESTAVVKRLYTLSSIGFMVRFLVPQFLGICALVYFYNDEAMRAFFFQDGKLIDSPEATMQAMPLFLSQILPVGVIGIIGAGMLAAFMSTHDSYLLCWASVLVEDVVNPIAGGRLEVKTRLVLTRTAIVVIAVFLLVWSLWYPLGQDLWDYMAATGAIYFSGAFSLLLFGLYWKGASRAGAYAALAAGTTAVFGLKTVRDAVERGLKTVREEIELDFLSSEVAGLSTVALACVLMVTFSLVFPDRNQLES